MKTDFFGRKRNYSIWGSFWSEAHKTIKKNNINPEHIKTVIIDLLPDPMKPNSYSYFIKFYLDRDYNNQENWIEERN